MKINLFTNRAIDLALLSGAAFSVSAATYDLGAVSPTLPTSFNAVVFSQTIDDNFKFTLPTNSGSGYSVINFPVGIFFNSVFNSAGLYSNYDGILGNGDDTLLSPFALANNKLTQSWGPSPAGDYFLKIAGTTSGVFGGLYNGSISVTAVPEPENYTMLLAGLAVIGTIAVHRRNRANSY